MAVTKTLLLLLLVVVVEVVAPFSSLEVVVFDLGVVDCGSGLGTVMGVDVIVDVDAGIEVDVDSLLDILTSELVPASLLSVVVVELELVLAVAIDPEPPFSLLSPLPALAPTLVPAPITLPPPLPPPTAATCSSEHNTRKS